jgi:hypothetical protein
MVLLFWPVFHICHGNKFPEPVLQRWLLILYTPHGKSVMLISGVSGYIGVVVDKAYQKGIAVNIVYCF